MKQLMNITAYLHEPGILRNVIEKLASRHVDMGYTDVAIPQEWKSLESSSIEAYVSGNFNLHADGSKTKEQFDIPFDSCFSFTCIKGKNDSFKLEWSSSLS